MLDGVVRIGAVNCMDDWSLCNQQQIQAFPSLIMYPKREKFSQHKTIEKLLHFALSFTKGKSIDLNDNSYLNQLNSNDKPWLISFCLNSNDNDDLNYELNCLDDTIKRKIAIMLNGLVNVASVECNSDLNQICSKLKPIRSNPIALYSHLPRLDTDKEEVVVNLITSTDYKQIAQQVMSYLPDLTLLDQDSFKVIINSI